MPVPIQTAIISSTIGAIVAILGVFLKDYWIPLLFKKKEKQEAKLHTFKKYADPIIASSISLFWRLKEVYDNRGSYLKADAPNEKYNNYKKVSTIYRFCALLGWIRAAKRELSFFEVEKEEDYKEIKKALDRFTSSLADGHHVENLQLELVINKLSISLDGIDSKERVKLAIVLNDLIKKFLSQNSGKSLKEIGEENSLKLCKEIAEKICSSIDHKYVDIKRIESVHKNLIQSLDRNEYWIYRDWQSAVGDLMIEEVSGWNRRFDVIGFKDFENIFDQEEDELDKWIIRILPLFENLDVSLENSLDVRVQQLRNVRSSTLEIIDSFQKIRTGVSKISNEALEKMRTFDMKDNYSFYQEE